MSVLVPERLELKFPEKPTTRDPYVLAAAVIHWTKKNVPYTPNNYYRPSYAETKGGVNCYGVARAAAQLAEYWNFPSGIVLNREHASTIAKFGNTVLFIEAGNFDSVETLEEAGKRTDPLHKDRLGSLYTDMLPDALDEGSCRVYFDGPHQDDKFEPWQERPVHTIRTGKDISNCPLSHIIVSAEEGAEMLCAIGDLRRYLQTDQERYAQEYPALIDLVPDFTYYSPPQTFDRIDY